MKTGRVAHIGWGNSRASNRADVFPHCFSLSVVMENSQKEAVVELKKKKIRKGGEGEKEKRICD